jgi:transcriptional regulator with XRE-family HTH domain
MTEVRLSVALRALRVAAGFTQKDAADAAEAAGYAKRMDADAWSKLECERREPTFEEAKLLLGLFGAELRVFVDGEDATGLLSEE